MIELHDITKTYGNAGAATQVLKGVSFTIDAGEYVAIMGTSGTGKSTLMNILGLLDRASDGRYLLDGTNVTELDDKQLSRLRNKKLGFVFQQFHLLERTSARRNVQLPLIYAEDYPHDADERAERVLVTVGLSDRVDYRPNELSGGQQQRVAIARALINDPELILADEPTGNLDRRSGLEVLDVFKRLHEQGRTLLVVTHDQAVAEHADRVVVLADGQVVENRRVDHPLIPREELEQLKQEVQS
ncbi:MAG: ABC transporter ATP-binding protein [Planctomycetes bacterium]|nr:ABC transporter ATP-binding protein [Planctomycetota bacterium]